MDPLAAHDTPPVGTPRTRLLARRRLREGWLLLLAGLVVPPFALVSVAIGWQLRRSAWPRQAIALIALGTVIFVVRLALWRATG